MNRRRFFKSILSTTGMALAAPLLIAISTPTPALAEESRRKKVGSPASDMVDVNDATAKALGYIENAKKNKKSAGNSCANCSLYVKTDSKNGKEIGTCAIFPKKFVVAKGYCNSWAKKA